MPETDRATAAITGRDTHASRQLRGPPKSSVQPGGKPVRGGRWASQGPGFVGDVAGLAPRLPRLVCYFRCVTVRHQISWSLQ